MTPIKIFNPEEMSTIPDAPQTLYKYRSWSKECHRSIISEQTIYLASPEEFEDPIDCKIPIRYDLLTNKEIHEMYIRRSKEDHPEWNRRQFREHARVWAKQTPFKNKKFFESHQQTFFEDFFKRMGVFCLTAEPVNVSMWEKYGDGHKGFCVGFHFSSIFHNIGGGGLVEYYDTLPIISPLMEYEEQHFLQVLSKERKWEFEREYRTYNFYPEGARKEDRLVVLPKDAYKEIIFGLEMTTAHKHDIINICKMQDLHVDFYEVQKPTSDSSISLCKYVI